MNFEEWLESKGHIDGYRTDYQSAYDEGFDEGVKTQQAKIDQLNKKNSEEKRILHNVIEMNQAKIDELQKLRSLDEMAINQLAQANQVWQIKCDELQARIDVYELHTKTLKNIHDNDFKEHSESSYILGNLDGFFECLESDLKGNKDEN